MVNMLRTSSRLWILSVGIGLPDRLHRLVLMRVMTLMRIVLGLLNIEGRLLAKAYDYYDVLALSIGSTYNQT